MVITLRMELLRMWRRLFGCCIFCGSRKEITHYPVLYACRRCNEPYIAVLCRRWDPN